ncbi:MAG: hypothetical protein M1816_000691 [Peltula sp. TS41687]|nr:MAG: hypothetical protein M1816_000691 [Peltula sp. TS41687]
MAPSTRAKAPMNLLPKPTGDEPATVASKDVLNKAEPTVEELAPKSDEEGELSDALTMISDDQDDIEDAPAGEPSNKTAKKAVAGNKKSKASKKKEAAGEVDMEEAPQAEESNGTVDKPAAGKRIRKPSKKKEANDEVAQAENANETTKKPTGARKAKASTKKEAPAKQATTKAATQAEPTTKPDTSKGKKRNAPDAEADEESGAEEPVPPKKRRGVANPKGRKVAASYEEADEADKMLWDSRREGKPWNEVKEAWTKITGEETAASTLPNRLDRLKTVWFKLEPAEEAILVGVKQEYEARCYSEKWSKIAEMMAEQGSDKHPAKALEKYFKDVISKRNTTQDQDTAE